MGGGRCAVIACFLVALAGRAAAEDDDTVRWAATLEAAAHAISFREADDGVTGFFDQYRFTPSKSDDVPVELGLTEASFDWLRAGETPALRFRLESPTSNLGVSDARDPFLNQRALLSGALPGLGLGLSYRRLRTEALRRFPDPAGSALLFSDLTRPNDRFFSTRTGFDGTLRLRPDEAWTTLPDAFSMVSAELELRGGVDTRDGQRQRRFLLPPSNDWISLSEPIDQRVDTIGGGVLVAPGGLFTLAFDADHQRFREAARTHTDAALGAPFPSSTRTIGFVPDTDRTTGAIRFRSRLGTRAGLQGGLQLARLEQVPGRTPDQRTAGLDHNRLLFTAANLAADVALLGGLSANAFFRYDERDNDIDRNTALFNATGGTQVDEFLDHLRRIAVGGELVYAFPGRNRVSIGATTERVDRELDFVPVPVGRRILPPNAWVSDASESTTVYGRARLRPLRGFDVRAELGYRDAPRTGYAVELDDYVYGRVDASYTVPIARPLLLSAFARGGSGENRDFAAVGGLGPSPAGGRTGRDFERTETFWGIQAAASPWQRLSVFASFFSSRDAQDYDLVVSDLQRFFQDVVPLTFAVDAPIEYRSEDLGVLSSASLRIGESTDASVSYAFDRVDVRYGGGSGTGRVETIGALARIDADIHRVGVRVGRQLAEGLRVHAGYRIDLYDDRSPVHGASGAARPFALGAQQHTVTVGVTLTNDVLDRIRSGPEEDD